MWLDSKAVNCPQKWGNFSWSLLIQPAKIRSSSSQGLSTKFMVD